MLSSPSNLELLLHYYVSPDPHPRCNAPAIKAGIQKLLGLNLIRPVNEPNCYEPTQKGVAHIKCLLCLPLPTQMWVAFYDNEAQS